jgi:small-conductance mechanosensitive channel
MSDLNDDKYDITTMVAKPLYFGMVTNVMLPAGLLFVCYYISNTYVLPNRLPELANPLFYALIGVSVLQAAFALWWRNRRFNEPMIHRKESFEQDMTHAIIARSRPVFLLIASISVWGYLYFFLTGRFRETAIFVLIAFVVFQVVRPRYGSVQKLIAHQEKLVEEGKLVKSMLL